MLPGNLRQNGGIFLSARRDPFPCRSFAWSVLPFFACRSLRLRLTDPLSCLLVCSVLVCARSSLVKLRVEEFSHEGNKQNAPSGTKQVGTGTARLLFVAHRPHARPHSRTTRTRFDFSNDCISSNLELRRPMTIGRQKALVVVDPHDPMSRRSC